MIVSGTELGSMGDKEIKVVVLVYKELEIYLVATIYL